MAEEQSVWSFRGAGPTGDPRALRPEVSVGDATLRPEPEDVAALLREALT